MFCPICGLEEKHSNQFCRACGSNLNVVRSSLEKPDSITASAAMARDEIGRAIASKIREIESADELKKVAEDVLPEIEKFLESPEEKRLRRIRTGTLIAAIGAGAAIAFTLVAVLVDGDLAVIAGMGLVTLFIGLSFIINGLSFTVPKKMLLDKSSDADQQRELDAKTSDLVLPAANDGYASVTESTPRHLAEKQPVSRS